MSVEITSDDANVSVRASGGMVYTIDLRSIAVRHEGSSPSSPIK